MEVLDWLLLAKKITIVLMLSIGVLMTIVSIFWIRYLDRVCLVFFLPFVMLFFMQNEIGKSIESQKKEMRIPIEKVQIENEKDSSNMLSLFL